MDIQTFFVLGITARKTVYSIINSIRTFTFTVFTTLFFFSLTPNAAFSDPHYNDFQTWLQVTTYVPLDTEKKFQLYTELQPRLADNSSDIERLLVRPALVYNVTPAFSLFLGYAWTPLFLNSHYSHDYRNEQRIWEQALYTQEMEESDFTFQYRLRQEQRFIEDTSETANRTRLLIRASHPFCPGGSTGLTGYNEYFLNWNKVDNGPKRGFDRDRVFFGPYLIDGKARYEIGYLGEYGNHFRDGDRIINGVMGSATFKF